MAKHTVKCLYCGLTFDTETEEYAKPRTNRYAHKTCYEQHLQNRTKEEIDYELLLTYIKQKFGNNISPRLWKQLKEYKDSGEYTYSGIYKTLFWWFEVKHHNVEDCNGGIGIVPYIYQDALKYYYALYLAELANKDKTFSAEDVKIREFFIQPPAPIRPKPRMFKFSEEEE